MIAPVSDGNTAPNPLFVDPLPGSNEQELPNLYDRYPGIDPAIFYSQMDGVQVDLLGSGITNPVSTRGELVAPTASSPAPWLPNLADGCLRPLP